jgi:hypothetical protein
VASFGVEPVVSVVYLAKQNGHSLFKEGQLWGKLGLGHLKLLWTGRSRMALFLSYKPRNTHLGGGGFWPYSPDCLEIVSENCLARANRLTIRRVIAT